MYYTAGQDKEPDYVGQADKHFDRREHTLDLLAEGLALMGDAWWCLFNALKDASWFQADADDVREIEQALWALQRKLQPIVDEYCGGCHEAF
jgi:hypothetical protein